MQKLSSLSVFFPAFNEHATLPILLTEALKVFPQFAHKLEILVIDDGSTDRSVQIVKKFAKHHPEVKIFSHPKNLGYGAALRTGIRLAKYDWIFFTDADMQFDFSDFAHLVKHAPLSSVIIGWRKNRAEGIRRELNAKLFKIYIDLLFRLGVKDIDCAFKLFRREVVQSVQLETTGAFTTSELLYKLKKMGIKFVEEPVTHYPRRFGKPTGANLGVIVKAVWEAFFAYLKMKLSSFKR